MTEEHQFRADDDVEVFYRRWLPTGSPRLVVLVAHGMSEHSARYARVAAALRDAGDAVYALDHRGHGRTADATGPGRTGGAGMPGVLADLDRLADIARSDVGDAPAVLFGHSMGALIALAYAEQYGSRLAGLALSGSPGASDGAGEMAAAMRAVADGGLADEPVAEGVGALSMFNTAFEPARTPYDWLSRDPAEVDAYIADPRAGIDVPMTHGFLADLMEMAATEIQPTAIGVLPATLPILLLTGEADPVSNQGAAVRVLEARLRAAGLCVDAIYYPDARHEVLNEINRDEVTADLLAWLARIAS